MKACAAFAGFDTVIEPVTMYPLSASLLPAATFQFDWKLCPATPVWASLSTVLSSVHVTVRV